MSFESTLPPYNAGDSLATYVNSSCLDFLFAELVPMTDRVIRELDERKNTEHQANLDEAHRAALQLKLQSLGYRVGQGLAERFARDKPRFNDHLEIIKFLCKDLWTLLFRKQIDNLKTNHRGVYVLSDNSFYAFRRMSMKTPASTINHAQKYLWLPCGIIRGVLVSLGIEASVHAETSELPAATFQIKTIVGK